MDEPRLHVLRGHAERFDVGDVDGVFAGFVVTFAAGATYDSENFSRFSGRYDDFAYLDRIVLHEDFQRRGLGGCVYDVVEGDSRAHGRLTSRLTWSPATTRRWPSMPAAASSRSDGSTTTSISSR